MSRAKHDRRRTLDAIVNAEWVRPREQAEPPRDEHELTARQRRELKRQRRHEQEMGRGGS